MPSKLESHSVRAMLTPTCELACTFCTRMLITAAMRLANAIDRSLEHPERPEETVALILQGVAARYACCPNPAQHQFPKSLSDMGAGQIRKLVSHISVSQNGAISVCLKGRRRIV